MYEDTDPRPQPRYDRGGSGTGKLTAVMAPKPPEPKRQQIVYEKPGGHLWFWLIVVGLATYWYLSL